MTESRPALESDSDLGALAAIKEHRALISLPGIAISPCQGSAIDILVPFTSERHKRWTRLSFTRQPSRRACLAARRQPHRGRLVEKALNHSLRATSSSGGSVPMRRWVERCWPTTVHARRSETPNRSCSVSTAQRRRFGVRSFPRPAP